MARPMWTSSLQNTNNDQPTQKESKIDENKISVRDNQNEDKTDNGTKKV